MSKRKPGITSPLRISAALLVCSALIALLVAGDRSLAGSTVYARDKGWLSDHCNGNVFFNPGIADGAQRRSVAWLWRFITGKDWSTWPETADNIKGERPASRANGGSVIITPVGHGTFLIQMDGLNILTDPIWSERCSPVSWAGPRRHRAPGIKFEDLPPIDAVLVSHNHYDHLDMPTLKRLAAKGVRRSVTPLGNRKLILDAGIPAVDELDWWQTVRLSDDVKVTVVPAQHFSARRPWDRNKTLWGGFVISGPSGNIFYSGDTGYGPHFREIAKRFSTFRAALLPISPYWPDNSSDGPRQRYARVHMNPADAVQAHLDLGARVSIAAHFQVFQLGGDGFEDAPKDLSAAMARRDLKPGSFVAPLPGAPVRLSPVKTS